LGYRLGAIYQVLAVRFVRLAHLQAVEAAAALGSYATATAQHSADAASAEDDAEGWAPRAFSLDAVDPAVDPSAAHATADAAAAATHANESTATADAFTYDESSGYYYDAKSGYYYDAASQLYYHPSTGAWYRHNAGTGQYDVIAADGADGGEGKGVKAEGSEAAAVSASAALSATAANDSKNGAIPAAGTLGGSPEISNKAWPPPFERSLGMFELHGIVRIVYFWC
jgi:RNA-binding protein 5/10